MLNLPALPPRVIPSLLLSEDVFVKTKRFRNPTYVGDPINTINLFNKFEVDEILVLDISCSRTGSAPNFSLIEELASECWVPLTYGGGIKSIVDARTILNSGVEKILVGSLIFSNIREVKEIIEEFGASSVVGCLSIKKNIFGQYKIYTHGKNKKVDLSLDAAINLLKKIGVGEVVINDIKRDGTRKGYDIDLIRYVSNGLTCPVVALGGAACLNDFKSVINVGANAAAAGSYFVFQNMSSQSVLINYPEREEIERVFCE